MPDVGYKGSYTNWQATAGVNNINQLATRIVMPTAGTITHAYAYFGGYYGTCRARTAVWLDTGAVLARGNELVVPQYATGSVGGQQWNGGALQTNPQVDAGQVLYVGWSRHPSDSHVWSHHSSTGTKVYHSTSGGETGPVALGFGDTRAGSVGAYIVYVEGATGRIRVAGTWVDGTVFVRDSGVWKPTQLRVRENGGWKP